MSEEGQEALKEISRLRDEANAILSKLTPEDRSEVILVTMKEAYMASAEAAFNQTFRPRSPVSSYPPDVM